MPRVDLVLTQHLLAIGLAVLVQFVSFPVAAQQKTGEAVSVIGPQISIDGPINQDTADDFLRELQANPSLENVSLNSPGGRVFPALDIARAISASGLNTSVPLGGECHSACSFIFLSGRERIADGLLGVHQVSGVNDPSLTQTAIGQIYEELVKFV